MPTLTPVWERSTVLRGPLLDRVRELKAQPGKGIVVTGSLSLMPELVAGGVIDVVGHAILAVVANCWGCL